MKQEIERNSKGQWIKGQSGNPSGMGLDKVKAQDYERVLRETVSLEDFAEATMKVLETVKRTGSIRGWATLADRLIGKPVQMEPSGGEQAVDKLRELMAEVAEKRQRAMDEEKAARMAALEQQPTINVIDVEASNVDVGRE